MGYLNSSVPSGYQMFTPAFEGISATYNLQEIVPSGDGLGGWGDVAVQVMNADGSWGGFYQYWTEDNSGVETGWYDSEMNKADVTISPAIGVMVQIDSDDVQLTTAGTVSSSDIEVSLPVGYTMLGNGTPVNVNVQDIVPFGDGLGGWGDVAIQFMNADGSWGGFYQYWTEDNSGVEDGWYDGSMNKATDTLTPGLAVMLQCDSDDVKVTIPSAL